MEDCQGKLYVEGISIVPGLSIGAEIAGPRVVTRDGAADGDTSHFLATQSGNPGHGAGYTEAILTSIFCVVLVKNLRILHFKNLYHLNIVTMRRGVFYFRD